MYKVRGIDPAGRAMAFACGTDEQALEKTRELTQRGFRAIFVTDPRGRELDATTFERSLGIESN